MSARDFSFPFISAAQVRFEGTHRASAAHRLPTASGDSLRVLFSAAGESVAPSQGNVSLQHQPQVHAEVDRRPTPALTDRAVNTAAAAERRQNSRRSRVEDHRIVTARIRPGYAAAVVDVSAAGTLIETTRRLLPGSLIDLVVETRDRADLIRGRVVRCSVVQLCESAIRYRAAIAFSSELVWLCDPPPEVYDILATDTSVDIRHD
jgi:hypothetical protein